MRAGQSTRPYKFTSSSLLMLIAEHRAREGAMFVSETRSLDLTLEALYAVDEEHDRCARNERSAAA